MSDISIVDAPTTEQSAAQAAFLREFENMRSYLIRLAYHVLGVWQEAEDIVQDVAAGVWGMPDGMPVMTSAKAYCTKAVMNRAINRKKTMQREIAASYWGVWLPEPDVCGIGELFESEQNTYSNIFSNTSSDTFSLEERSISLGLLRMMETLTPTERAVYVLVELFGETHREAAQTLAVQETNARKLLERARKKLEEGKKRFSASRDRHTAFFQAFATAAQEGRYDALHSLLKEDVAMYSDGGGKVVASRIVIRGREKNILALKNIAAWASKHEPSTWLPCGINGRVGAVAVHAATGNIIAALTMEADEEGITEMYSVRNPDKLRHLKTEMLLGSQ